MTESIAKDTYSGKKTKTIQDYRKAIQDYRKAIQDYRKTTARLPQDKTRLSYAFVSNGVLSLLGLYPDRDRWCSRLSSLSSAYDLRDTVCFWRSMLLVTYAFGDLCFW
ncbi:hypothetical protein EDC96DRAFT_550570 [Choanephora cucurbitarum]|nr:hypothetical protein EDC96DRAFT_550570 [Choanephora cucurbitarum]